MIDEKKIEEAAETQLAALGSYGLNEYEIGKIGSMVLYREEDVKESFKAGINWFLDNLWHDASEEPKEGKLIIGDVKLSEEEIAFGSMDKRMFIPDLSSIKWEELCEVYGYTRWLYIEDLLKGGK